MIQAIDSLNFIEKYQAKESTEQLFKEQLLALVQRQPDRFADRTLAEGHVTASAWILNENLTQTLLIHHGKLQKWFQPGGHIEPQDTSLWEAAKREAMEETGLTQLAAWPNFEIFDIDIHAIPAGKELPEHLHYDIRFAFVAEAELLIPQLSEVSSVAWVALDDMKKYNNTDSITRMVNKTLALRNISF